MKYKHFKEMINVITQQKKTILLREKQWVHVLTIKKGKIVIL